MASDGVGNGQRLVFIRLHMATILHLRAAVVSKLLLCMNDWRAKLRIVHLIVLDRIIEQIKFFFKILLHLGVDFRGRKVCWESMGF